MKIDHGMKRGQNKRENLISRDTQSYFILDTNPYELYCCLMKATLFPICLIGVYGFCWIYRLLLFWVLILLLNKNKCIISQKTLTSIMSFFNVSVIIIYTINKIILKIKSSIQRASFLSQQVLFDVSVFSRHC